MRRRAAAQPRVAALRHDRDAGVGAGAHDRGDLGRRRRAHDRQRPPRKRPRQSVRKGAMSASGVSTCGAPTTPARRASKVARCPPWDDDSTNSPRGRTGDGGGAEGRPKSADDPARPGARHAGISVFAAGRDGVHAADVESVRRRGPRLRAGRARRPRPRPAGMPFPNPAAMFATLDPAEIESKIGELKIVEGWLAMSLNMMQMSIRTMELQKASLEALRAGAAGRPPDEHRPLLRLRVALRLEGAAGARAQGAAVRAERAVVRGGRHPQAGIRGAQSRGIACR